ncbi:unnamed protein product [Rotaria sordida]|uniref:Uncharacterized protein n=2 Tax=Rotaria sordida TaxID=392033 RepID=A0A814ELK3_9BILA|nr:unnamed protein product [Rotaria sordida]
MIFELTTEERQSSTGNSQLQIIFTKPGDKTDDDKEDTDDAKTTSSSSSSLPMSRFEQNLLLQNDLNKSYQVQQWLNNLESSSNSAVEDTSEEAGIFLRLIPQLIYVPPPPQPLYLLPPAQSFYLFPPAQALYLLR